MNIKEIEALTFEQVEDWKNKGFAEKLVIKNHDCYLCDLGGGFDYSVLVFKNRKHIYFANDYQLHHSSKKRCDLKQIYIDNMNAKLFTEEELENASKSYEEYSKKSYYLRNYWIMQFEHISIFCAGNTSEDERVKIREKFKSMFYCKNSCCYVYDERIVKKSNRLMNCLRKSFESLKHSEECFSQMISYELANHEACITCDYREALDSLGLSFNELEDWQKRIVKRELSKQTHEYCNSWKTVLRDIT